MNARQIFLLEFLLKQHEYLSANQLAEKYGVSTKTVYQDIDKLERTKLKQHHYNKYYEAYPSFAWAALGLLLIEILLRLTWLRRIP